MTSDQDPARLRRATGAAVVAAMTAGAVLTCCAVLTGSAVLTGCAPRQHVAVGQASAPSTSPRSGCRAASLRADQLPISSGTGRSFLAWSVTNTGASTCVLAAGQPTLAFLDRAGAPVVDFSVTHLPSGTDAKVSLRAGQAAWFLTEEATANCGTGTVDDGGPFHYRIGLPGGSAVAWTASYLSASALSDVCNSVSLAVGDLQSTEPAGA